jgi:hypothetical protein
LIKSLEQPERIQILLAAYQKHASELLAIEESQEKLNTLLLSIYSAGFALIAAAVAKDAKPFLQTAGHPSYLACALMVLAFLLGCYALVMTYRRAHARETVRWVLSRIDNALGFFEPGLYVQDQALYPPPWQAFSKRKWLNWSVAIVIIVGAAFIAAVAIIGSS